MDDICFKPGTLLVATRALKSPEFARSVILIARNDESGITGFNLAGEIKGNSYNSGPLRTPDGNVVVLKKGAAKPPAVVAIGDTGYTMESIPLETEDGHERLHKKFTQKPPGENLLVGHFNWTPERLSMEIEQGLWTVSSTPLDTVFAHPAELRWCDASILAFLESQDMSVQSAATPGPSRGKTFGPGIKK
jgi:putative AlgH/UPF0301 family transcriptional regulator